jgi:ribonuclease Z
MPRVIILGSSNAIPAVDAENTHLVVVGEQRTVLIDAGSNPILRLEQQGVRFDQLSDIVVTHFHPDHVSGLPLLLMDMWLMGRQESIHIHGLDFTLDRLEGLMGFYNWSEWPGFFPVEFHRLAAVELATVLDCDDFSVLSSPVHHMIPAIGLRFEFKKNKTVFAYSCDTAPCKEVVRLGAGADVFLHESTGESFGHSSARQAGEIASRARAGNLILIHYPTGRFAQKNLLSEARTSFAGRIALARDLMVLDFDKKNPLIRRKGKSRGESGKMQRPAKPAEP